KVDELRGQRLAAASSTVADRGVAEYAEHFPEQSREDVDRALVDVEAGVHEILRLGHARVIPPDDLETRTVLWGVIGHQDNAKVWPLLVGISELLRSRAPHEIIGVPAIFHFDGDDPVEWCVAVEVKYRWNPDDLMR